MSPTGGPDPAPAPASASQTGAPHAGWGARRVVAAVAAGVIALPLLAGLWLVLSSTFGGDPHGYALLGGASLAVIAGIVLVCLVPWIFPAAVRLRAFGLALLGYLVLVVVIGVALASG